MKTLVIGDLHFDTKPFGLLQSQVETVKHIFWNHRDRVDRVVFLGDLMMHRRPYPSVLLALKEILDEVSNSFNEVYVLRGNHDSENKNDDGITALSLFNDKVNVITQTTHIEGATFIPHYEDEERIKKDLESVPDGNVVFGHFGYYGCLNSGGDADFNLVPSLFNNTTFLGHIHRHRIAKGSNSSIYVLGTPYTTDFTESGKDNFVAVIDEEDVSLIPVDFGPRHLIINIEDIEKNLEFINNPKYFTMLRVLLNSVDEDQSTVMESTKDIDVGYLEVKYRRVYHEEYDPGDYDTSSCVSEISTDIIKEYINSSSTKIPKNDLLEGLNSIYEYQENRDR